MKVKILKDFIYSLDGIKPTSFKKGDVVSSFNAKEVQKLTKSGRVGSEKASIPKQDPPTPPAINTGSEGGSPKNEKSDENSGNKNSDENSEKGSQENKPGDQNGPAKPQANRDGKDKTGDNTK